MHINIYESQLIAETYSRQRRDEARREWLVRIAKLTQSKRK